MQIFVLRQPDCCKEIQLSGTNIYCSAKKYADFVRLNAANTIMNTADNALLPAKNVQTPAMLITNRSIRIKKKRPDFYIGTLLKLFFIKSTTVLGSCSYTNLARQHPKCSPCCFCLKVMLFAHQLQNLQVVHLLW